MTNDNITAAMPVEDGWPAPQPGRVFGLPGKEQWAEWSQLRGIRQIPDRRPQFPGILQGIREFNDLAAIRQRLLDSQSGLDAQHSEMQARNDAQRERYHAELRQATLEGTEFPPKPVIEEWQGMAHDHEFFNRHHAILEAVERQLLHDRADEWKAYIRKLARPAHVKAAKAREALAQAETVLLPFTEAREALEKVVNAVAEKVGGAPAETDSRIVPPARRPGQVQAEQQALEDFRESRSSNGSRLSGRR